jgi:uncharacterized protein YneF (UPF0154 family)
MELMIVLLGDFVVIGIPLLAGMWLDRKQFGK